MKIAIIPARGGSKRIPYKNIRTFGGKPMIAHAIDIARRTGLFDEIVVSTDDAKIADVASEFGASVPFARPAALADDYTGMLPVIRHAIRECEGLGWRLEHVCCIYCCAPLVTSSDLHRAFELSALHRERIVFPVIRFPSAIQRALRLGTDHRVEPIWPENALLRSQDLEPAYYDAGQFYVATLDAWRNIDNVHAAGVALELESWRAVDIDTLEDWGRAEQLWNLLANDAQG